MISKALKNYRLSENTKYQKIIINQSMLRINFIIVAGALPIFHIFF